MPRQFRYEVIKEKVLREAKRTRNYRLPSERDMCAKYSISRNTARRALQELQDVMGITRHVGRGSFISESSMKRPITLVATFLGPELLQHLKVEAEAFMAQHPNYEIAISTDSDGTAKALHEKPGPKILLSPNHGYLQAMRLVKPLDKMAGFEESVAKLHPRSMTWMTDTEGNQHCYALPLFMQVDALAFNRSMAKELGLDYEKGPTDWEDTMTWIKRAAKIGIHGIEHPKLGEMTSIPNTSYLDISGGEPYLREENGRAVFSFEYGEEWMRLYRQLLEAGNVLMVDKRTPCQMIEGKSLMSIRAGSWLIKQALDKGCLDEMVIAQRPPVRTGLIPHSQLATVSASIMESPDNDPQDVKGAWAFIRFLATSPESQQRMVTSCSRIPVQVDVFADLEDALGWKPFIQTIETAVKRTDHPVQHGVTKVVLHYFELAIHGQMPIPEAASHIRQMAQLFITIENDRQFLS